MKSAIIVAEAAEERRAIAQFLKPTELFNQIHFCGTGEEVDFLLENSNIDCIFCDVYAQHKEARPFAARLVEVADSYRLQLVFFSHLDPAELSQLGVLPAGAQCLNYQASPASATALLSHLLRESPTAKGATAKKLSDNLIDHSSGIYNRFYFDALLDQELSRSKLTGRPFSLLLIEPQSHERSTLDASWSALSPSVTLTIKEQIRASDLLCRIEKKRLALLLPETTSSNAERVIKRIQGRVLELADGFPVSLKFGLVSPHQAAHFNRHGLLSAAEAAL